MGRISFWSQIQIKDYSKIVTLVKLTTLWFIIMKNEPRQALEHIFLPCPVPYYMVTRRKLQVFAPIFDKALDFESKTVIELIETSQ